ncbi:acyl-CoA dehydrogenase NM domain-like protein [Exidia glandulosa HHB12029]|uniref:Acyl-CoA dehydrogenase NM domain-like protein n=1 Tax=Exidia glandulosa HHB12029 TaxID=1314781 RepID=A0A165KPJ2_EXIGL|nr:acyl-CoA dehydrogenase NM domain-like protein [Exidia glandulosa HHB12029]
MSAPKKELKEFTPEEIAKHNKSGDLWTIIDGKVYDLSRFQNLHPGGLAALLDPDVAGQDATEIFYGLHRHEVLQKPQYARLQIGTVKGELSLIESREPGQISGVPYAEPTWLQKGYYSPYYTDKHREFQLVVRKFIDEVVYEDAQAREEDGKRVSQEVLDKMADVEMHAMRLGPGKHLKGRTLMGGLVKPEEFDYFHELIITQELTRVGARGYGDGLLGGMVIGLPPVLNFGSKELQERIVPDILKGKKFISLAISEAYAGSDVSNLKTTAVKSEDGKFWIVNGSKKWITNGTFSDYFTTGVRTDGGLTVLLIERGEGVETKQIKTSYSTTAGTAYITFDNVKVPVENTLGPENDGLRVILSNFNHERWVMCCASARSQRLVIEECLTWANQRQVFGKPLIAQAVIRNKLAQMIARTEAGHNWLENVTHQMNNMSYKEMSAKLAGQIAFLKMYLTQNAQDTARDAVQIFGGRGTTRTGMGRFIEHYHRTITFDSLLGGAEDVLGDLGVRQAIRKIPAGARL